MNAQGGKATRFIAGVLLAAGLLALPSRANAVLIDFDSIGVFTPAVAGDIVPLAGSVVTNNFQPLGVLFGKTGVSTGVAVVRDTLAPSSGLNTVAGLDAAGIIPGGPSGGFGVGDIYFSFVLPNTTTPGVTNTVSFTIGDGGGDVDVFQIRSFSAADVLINTQNVSGISRFPVTISVAGIRRVEVDFTGDFGYSLDDLTFNTPTPISAAVPAPATLALVALGLAGLGFTLRKKT